MVGRGASLFLLYPPLKWGDARLKGRKELASLKDALTLGGSEPGACLHTLWEAEVRRGACAPLGRYDLRLSSIALFRLCLNPAQGFF